MPPKKVSQPSAESARVVRTLFRDMARGVRDIKAALEMAPARGQADHMVGAAVQHAHQAAQLAAMVHGTATGSSAREGSEEAPKRKRLTGKQAPPVGLGVPTVSFAAPPAATKRRYTKKQPPLS